MSDNITAGALADQDGACRCAEFSGGRHKSAHNWGQPGCKQGQEKERTDHGDGLAEASKSVTNRRPQLLRGMWPRRLSERQSILEPARFTNDQ